ncbi:MAG: hypothetical protein KKF50_01620 [Nanoarchaeota archaeon]|nr:hypothetical protein [Nanoarchaeota archaeon]
MSFFGFFGKKKDVKMINSKKKNFLSNDFIERMVRVEQRVSISLGENKPYNKTHYYKSLLPHEKKEFDEYLLRKGDVKKGFLVAFFLLLVSILFLNVKFTGNAVSGVVGEGELSVLTLSIMGSLIVITFFLVVFFLVGKFGNKKFHKHFYILDKIGLSRAANKYFS